MIVYLARDIPAFVMYCVNGESVMIIDYHSNKPIIGLLLHLRPNYIHSASNDIHTDGPRATARARG